MAEIKNTFIKSKMNRDLDSRLVPSGEYREGVNISVSTSEGADVGALENIRGNTALITSLDFITKQDLGLEIIGAHVDENGERIFLFMTNYTDTSVNQNQFGRGSYELTIDFRNLPVYGATNYIVQYDVRNNSSKIIVEGLFLNFSKSAPILATNMIEQLLFWTDNRNQPRKIDVNLAFNDPLYYVREETISVAKYAPFLPVSFIRNNVYYRGVYETSLIDEASDYLAPFASTTFKGWDPSPTHGDNGAVMFVEESNASATGVNEPWYFIYKNIVGNAYIADAGASTDPDASTFRWSPKRTIDIAELAKYWKVIKVTNRTRKDGDYYLTEVFQDSGNANFRNCFGITDTPFIDSQTNNLDDTDLPNWQPGDIITFSIANPYYNNNFKTNNKDDSFLENKFVRFSYRFKYDNNEYSLMAPFSQAAFIPKQDGHFLYGDEDDARNSGIVAFLENKVTSVDVKIPLESPLTPYFLAGVFKVKEVEILMKESDGLAVKVVSVLNVDEFSSGSPSEIEIIDGGSDYDTLTSSQISLTENTNLSSDGKGLKVKITQVTNGEVTGIDGQTPFVYGKGYKVGDILTLSYDDGSVTRKAKVKVIKLHPYITYSYKSEKPIKVLPEDEITRVADIVPIKAVAQEAVGGRIVYGNFLQNLETPETLDFSVEINDRTASIFSSSQNTDAMEYPNHTLKQNRTYKVGLVLYDKFGRASNVITGKDGSSTFNAITNGGDDPLQWFGDCLEVDMKEQIPTERTSTYSGLYTNTNPLGWYSYRFVVQQQEQDYYNLYVGGTTSGILNVGTYNSSDDSRRIFFTQENDFGYISIFGDNINKLPRDLKEAGPQDKLYGSSKRLWNRLYIDTYTTPSEQVYKQDRYVKSSEVTDIKPFREFGDWTNKKGLDTTLLYASGGQVDDDVATSAYAYPGAIGNVDPFFRAQQNSFIAALKTPKRYGFYAETPFDGFTGGIQNGVQSTSETENLWKYSNKLNIYEVEPTVSNLNIYYETSTTGLISDLNRDIATSSNAPENLEIDYFQLAINENSSPASIISNEFEIIFGGGSFLNQETSKIELLDVLTGPSLNTSIHNASISSNESDPSLVNTFNLIETTPGNTGQSPRYSIRYFNGAVPPTSTRLLTYIADSSVVDNYKFIFRLIDEDGNSAVVEKNGSLTNNIPSIGRGFQFFTPGGLNWKAAKLDDSQNNNYRGSESFTGTSSAIKPWAYRRLDFNDYVVGPKNYQLGDGIYVDTNDSVVDYYKLWEPGQPGVGSDERTGYQTITGEVVLQPDDNGEFGRYRIYHTDPEVKILFQDFSNGARSNVQQGCDFYITQVTRQFGTWDRDDDKWNDNNNEWDSLTTEYKKGGGSTAPYTPASEFDWKLEAAPRNQYMTWAATRGSYIGAGVADGTVNGLYGNTPLRRDHTYTLVGPRDYEEFLYVDIDMATGQCYLITRWYSDPVYYYASYPAGRFNTASIADPSGQKSGNDTIFAIKENLGNGNSGFSEIQKAADNNIPNKLGHKVGNKQRGAVRWIVKVGMSDATDVQSGIPGSGSLDDPTVYEFCVQCRRTS